MRAVVRGEIQFKQGTLAGEGSFTSQLFELVKAADSQMLFAAFSYVPGQVSTFVGNFWMLRRGGVLTQVRAGEHYQNLESVSQPIGRVFPFEFNEL